MNCQAVQRVSRLLLALTVLLFATLPLEAQENVLLVVNADSAESLELANHYQQLRNIPGTNVVYVSGIERSERDSGETATSEAFYKSIFQPVQRAIKQRGLEDQIDYVTFSCDFPTRISCKPELIKFQKATGTKYNIAFHAPGASLTSSMFFGEQMFSDQPVIFDAHSNWFAMKSPGASRAFSNKVGYLANGQTGPQGRRYRLSTILAVNHPTASTIQQARKQLTRSVEADGTFPKGVFYFAKNGDPRSRTRTSQFAKAEADLKQLGHKVIIDKGATPKNQQVIGATLGSPKINWSASKSKFAKGALCDNFTSYGGWWRKAEQTHLTEFLNAGAAGSTGTITEPYTIARKIPTASIHVHYARGCNLADSIYQTVTSPFQLLIVGDPLCRPFGARCDFEVEGIQHQSVVKRSQQQLMLKTKTGAPRSENSTDTIGHFLAYLDGREVQKWQPDQAVKLPLAELEGGFHELRIVAVSDSIGRVRTSKVFEFFLKDDQVPMKSRLKLSASSLKVSQTLDCQISELGGQKAELWHNGRKLGTLSGDRALKISAAKLGVGNSRLFAVIRRGDQLWVTVPAEVEVTR